MRQLLVVIVGAFTLALLTANDRLIGAVERDRTRTQAMAVADAQIALVRLWPTYASLDSAFAGTVADVPLPGWTRRTTVTRHGGGDHDYDFKRITVTVMAPDMSMPVVRSITVSGR